MSKNSAIARQHLDARFAQMKSATLPTRPMHGWVRAIRDSLGMSAAQLAARLGVSRPRISALEQAEVEGSLTLKSLERAAEALGCRLVYALIPNQSLEETVQAQARRIALQHLALVEHTMGLEDQAVERTDTNAHLEAMVKALIEKEIRRLWDL